MEKDPKEQDRNAGGHSEEDHPGNVEGPGNVTVDEPTDTSLSGTSKDDFADGDDSESSDD